MKVSIITAIMNGVETIEHCIKSVIGQSYRDIEYIIVDGGSTDGTLDIINRYQDRIAKVLSEPDKGIFDALNKGIKLASGEIIGFLHADDFYAHEWVIEKIVSILANKDVDSCYGDLQYINRENPQKIVRYWKASSFAIGKFKYGWMPPHPTFFMKKWIYEKYGYFDTDFKIAADYELMLRFLVRYRISTYYLPETLIKMRLGGQSNKLLNLILKSYEDYRAWKVNNLKGGFSIILLKNLIKIPQFFRKGNNNSLKRKFDFFLALVGLFISLPVWPIIGLAIWLEDGKPIFYFQDRCGKDGKIFKSIKFRSMILLAEDGLGPLQAKENDSRVTKIGKILRATAMDELPQLLNILRGDMSFVGPRVLRPVEIDSEDNQPKSIWEFEGFKERSRIKPGLTGVAQVLASRDIPRREKFKYDIWYVNNQNLWLDIKLIILSFFTTFMGKWETRKPRFNGLTERLHCQIKRETLISAN